MSKDKIKCPVCGQEVEPEITICPSCSFEIHILPSDLPAEIEELEKRRVEYGKKVLLSIKEENQRLSEEIANKSKYPHAKLAKSNKYVIKKNNAKSISNSNNIVNIGFTNVILTLFIKLNHSKRNACILSKFSLTISIQLTII